MPLIEYQFAFPPRILVSHSRTFHFFAQREDMMTAFWDRRLMDITNMNPLEARERNLTKRPLKFRQRSVGIKQDKKHKALKNLQTVKISERENFRSKLLVILAGKSTARKNTRLPHASKLVTVVTTLVRN